MTFWTTTRALTTIKNNAGAYYDQEQHVLSANFEIVRAAIETNLIGAWRMVQAFVPLMRRHRYGRIVNVSSGAGAFHEAGSDTPAYRVSKAALNMLTVSLAIELKQEPILVNAACPGWVRTDMGAKLRHVHRHMALILRSGWRRCPQVGLLAGFFAIANVFLGRSGLCLLE